MPFTFSHPALVFPFAYFPQKYFSWTGLIIGSMTPDFEYFIRMRILSIYSHTFSGLFWFDLPLGIAFAFIFHNVIKKPLFDNLPNFFQVRFAKYRKLRWNRHFKYHSVIVVVSILIGAASHILWDSFTHSTGFFAQLIPFLSSEIPLFNQQIPIHKILQHVSTLIGGLIVLITLLRLPPQTKKTRTVNKRYWLLFLLITSIIVVLRLLTGLNINMYGHVIATGISAIFIASIATPLLLKRFKLMK